MNLDLVSISVMTALVVNVSGVVFVVETIIRRDEGAGRVWAVAFLSGMLTTVSYLVWANDASAWWAVAVGNGSLVAATGFNWLGCRTYNRRRMLEPALIVVAGATIEVISALLAGPDGGPWAGAPWMFIAICGFAVAGTVEALRGDMGRKRTSWTFAFVLGLQALFYLVRIVVLVITGTEGDFFTVWFGTVSANLLTVTLTIVALVVTSVLRADRAQLRGSGQYDDTDRHDEDILPAYAFARVFGEVAARAKWRTELIGIVAVRIDDLEQISTAFGSETARSVADAWRNGVRRHAPASATVGEDDADGLVVGIASASASEARRQAALIYRGVFEDLTAVVGGVIPVVGVGVALSEAVGYDVQELVRVARDAATRAAMSVESSVLMGESADEPFSSL